MIPKIYPLSETAACIEFGSNIDEATHQQVVVLNKRVQLEPFIGLLETVPAYTTLTVYYQPELINSANNSAFG